MSLDADWRARIDAVDAVLIDEYQSDFPVETRPFERLAVDRGDKLPAFSEAA